MHGWLTVNESYTDEVEEIIYVSRDAAKATNGSYGIIYLHDDSDKEHFNEFQVFVFKHGECSKVRDKMLSPCIPVIEADIYNKNIQKEEYYVIHLLPKMHHLQKGSEVAG